MEYEEKIFLNIKDLKIGEVINKIIIAAGKRMKEGRFKVRQEN